MCALVYYYGYCQLDIIDNSVEITSYKVCWKHTCASVVCLKNRYKFKNITVAMGADELDGVISKKLASLKYLTLIYVTRIGKHGYTSIYVII